MEDEWVSDFDKWHQPVRFTDASLDIRDAEVCMTCHTVLGEPDNWPEDGPEWSYPNVQVPWPCAAYQEVERLRGLEHALSEHVANNHSTGTRESWYWAVRGALEKFGC